MLFSLPVEPRRRKIILCEKDFPTVGFVLAEARRLGLSPVFLKGGPHLADPDAWREAFSDEAHLVHITHVFSNLGLKTPVADIVARARANGVITVVDAAQSAGAVEVAADAWGADFLTGTAVKYMCGGPGACFLWVNPSIAPKCAPLDVGWFSHENPFEFNIDDFRYAEGARRFWGGTPSIAPLAIAAAGAEILGRTGVDAIASHNQALIARLLAAIPENSIMSHVRTGERGCAVIIKPKRTAEAAAALAEAKIAHDARIGGFRFSAHLYNDEGDIDRLIATLTPFL